MPGEVAAMPGEVAAMPCEVAAMPGEEADATHIGSFSSSANGRNCCDRWNQDAAARQSARKEFV